MVGYWTAFPFNPEQVPLPLCQVTLKAVRAWDHRGVIRMLPARPQWSLRTGQTAVEMERGALSVTWHSGVGTYRRYAGCDAR